MIDKSELDLPRLGEKEEFRSDLTQITPDQWRKIRAYYLALVAHVDDCIGKILATLKKTGLYDNTIIIFTSDHGEYLGDHGRVGKGMPGHDCIIRMPLIVRYPEIIRRNTVIPALTEAVDLVPTLLDLCGIQIPSDIQGRSFRALLSGKKQKHREDVYTEMFGPQGDHRATVRTSTHKYYCRSDGSEILFDLKKDPHELRNIIGEESQQGVLSEMRKRLILRLEKAALNSRQKEAEY